MKFRTLMTITIAISIFAISITPGNVTGYNLEKSSNSLPVPLSSSSAVWDGAKFYLFGGRTPGEILTTIRSFDPESGVITDLDVELPTPIHSHSAIWVGDEAYIFGGVSYSGEPVAEIVRFRPPDTIELINDSLEYGLKGGSTVWSGKYIYHFGNCIGTAKCGQANIIRFDPSTSQSEVLEEELPGPRAGTSAVWVNGSAYIFGGKTGVGTPGISSDIIKFTPDKGFEVMNAQLPTPRFHTSAFWDGNYAYIFGGNSPDGFLDEIIQYDPIADNVEILQLKLPTPRASRAGAFNGEKYYLFGGDDQNSELDEILEFDFTSDLEKGVDFGNIELPVAIATILILLIIITVVLLNRVKNK
ncbi:MAG: hypothetical protein KAJ51_17215 [Thermoplasmata archaeon]|nr:hypothetical protein [Thermoplasmata archaeon]